MGLLSRLKHGYDAFLGRDPTNILPGPAYSFRPDRVVYSRGNERSIVTAVYNRIAMDVAAIDIKHVDCDESGRFVSERKDSGLNNCLTLEANLDQTGREFIQDVVTSMFDEGAVAMVPTVTTTFPKRPGAFDINELRTGKIISWKPESVIVDIYNPHTGKHEQKEFLKRFIGIVQNPFYEIMNEPNSTLKRLIYKLALLDDVDKQNGAGKIDIIIQLPFQVRTPARRAQAEERRKAIESQLTNSKYGIAYTDATEHITQLGRSVDNTLPAQIQSLKDQFYAQLAITEDIMKGTASESTMQNYYSRTIEPIVSAIVNEMTRKFLTKTARSQHQAIMFFRDPFELVPVSALADIADRFTRNAILSSNEVRAIIGYKAVDAEDANALRNKNIAASNDLGSIPKGYTGESNDTSSASQEDSSNNVIKENSSLTV